MLYSESFKLFGVSRASNENGKVVEIKLKGKEQWCGTINHQWKGLNRVVCYFWQR